MRPSALALATLLPIGSAAAEIGLPGPEATAPAGPGQVLPAASIEASLPHDLSPWGMFLQADIVVKAVMAGLVLASLATWTVWLAKSLQLAGAKHRMRRGRAELAQSGSLAEAAERIAFGQGDVALMIRAASAEIHISGGAMHNIEKRVLSRLERIEAGGGRRMMAGTGVLATIGSTAPFVGLFGTVWGIMNAFVGISKAQTTNLAVVAPGIAEALLATAIGLMAAIPAVVVYNLFARSIAGYRAGLADVSAEIQRLVSRDLDRHRPFRAKAGE